MSKITRDLIEEAKLFKQVFKSDLGEKVLKILEQEFTSDPDRIHTPGDSHSTEFKLGCAKPLHFINLMIKLGESNDLEK